MGKENDILINEDKTIKGVFKIVDNKQKLIISYHKGTANWDAEVFK